MACTHPIVFNGKCADCGALINAQNGANYGVQIPHEQTSKTEPTQPENGEKTATTRTRKRKA